jgi:anti-sigma factor RsiW
MNCKEFIELLGEYVEMTVTPDTLAELQAHLAECAPCQAYLQTYRRTRELAAGAERAALPPGMPAEMKAHLRAFLRAQILREES